MSLFSWKLFWQNYADFLWTFSSWNIFSIFRLKFMGKFFFEIFISPFLNNLKENSFWTSLFHIFSWIFMNLSFLQNTWNTIRKNFKEIRECIHDKMVKKIHCLHVKRHMIIWNNTKYTWKNSLLFINIHWSLVFLHDLCVFSVYTLVFHLFLQ